MQTVKLRSHVGEDGVLRLNVPIGLNNTDLEVIVVVQPVTRLKRSHQDSKKAFQQLRQKLAGRVYTDSVQLLREDRER
jgi:hypothetical protein